MTTFSDEEDELATEKVECYRCEEIVARIETENGTCNWCLEAEHQVQERHR